MATSTATTGYSKGTIRIVSQLGVTNTAESSMCSPSAGKTVTLKYIKATNADPSTVHYLCVSIGADVSATRIIDAEQIAGGGSFERFVSHILVNGDILCASADAGSKVTLTITGTIEVTP